MRLYKSISFLFSFYLEDQDVLISEEDVCSNQRKQLQIVITFCFVS